MIGSPIGQCTIGPASPGLGDGLAGLYSSGIICQNSPEFDDLFGFSVEDVLIELKRGNRLICYRCKRKGATVGCEVKRCKKSYHYPCAVRDGAQNFDDHREEKFTLYCQKHNLEIAATNETVSRALSFNGDSDTAMNNNGETSPKLFCLVCERKEESLSLEHMDSGIDKLYCEKHKPQSLQKELKGLDAVAGPSSSHSDSNMSTKRRQKQTPKRRLSCSSTLNCEKDEPQSLQKELKGLDAVAGPSSSHSDSNMSTKRRQKQTPKRRLSCSSTPEVKSSKKSRKGSKSIQDDFSNSDGDVNGIDMELAPLESDLEDGVFSEHRNHAEALTTGCQPEPENRDDSDGDHTVIDSDAESQSLLLPVMLCVASEEPSQDTNISVCSSQPCSAASPGSPVLSGRHGSSLTLGPISSVHSGPLNVTNTPTRTSPPVPPDCCFTPVSSPHSVSNRPPAGPGGLGSPIASGSDSAASRVFWGRCNEAGCTQSIFTTFFSDMVSISNRILSDKASQEDYDLSLRVMEASGKLSQMLSEQEREFKKKQMELQRATAAIRDARSALKR
ncbi:serine-rich adhesin for platelets-like isoform X4 [Salvelinus alpinus]|uniref:serine-rich adhesin for platelets-like isoform X4 n=1 Tax=Salvelinus alpinus TaxID=8036 RepID=UPI0039FD1B8B